MLKVDIYIYIYIQAHPELIGSLGCSSDEETVGGARSIGVNES